MTEHSDMGRIALNAIRYRSQRSPEDDGEAMAKGDRRWLLRYIDEAEAASGPALTTGDVAKALIESDLIPRYLEYARLSPSMNPAETVEHIAATWAPRILAHLAPAAAEPAEALRCDCVVIKRPHVLADHWVPEP